METQNPLLFQVEHLVLDENIQNVAQILQKGRVLAWHVCLLLLPSLFALPLPPVDQIHQASNRGRLQRCVKYRRIILSCRPLMVFISKMVPMNDSGRFYAFGRVFSGTV